LPKVLLNPNQTTNPSFYCEIYMLMTSLQQYIYKLTQKLCCYCTIADRQSASI